MRGLPKRGRTYNLDTQFFNNNPQVQLLQLRWHPGTHTDSILVLLFSDNTLRVYDNDRLRYIWRVGPEIMRNESNKSASMLNAAMGETVIDFDIGPAIETGVTFSSSSSSFLQDDENELSLKISNLSMNASKSDTKIQTVPKIQWPIIILRENGNIYIMKAGINTIKPRLQGPITMLPQEIGNYGTDSCSILCIPSVPLTIVIAESNGTLHHAVLLEDDELEESFNEVDATLNVEPTKWYLHVLETVTLELGLPSEEINITEEHQCPIFLKRDSWNSRRYFAYHMAGLHIIDINCTEEIKRFLQSEDEVESDIGTLQDSDVLYVVCTTVETNKKQNPILGFVTFEMPLGVALLLGSSQVISLKLLLSNELVPVPLKDTKNDNEKKDVPLKSKFNEMLETSFEEHMSKILQRTVTQPILSSKDTDDLSSFDLYELFAQSKEVLKTEYIKKFEVARFEILKRVKILKLRKELEREEIENLLREREAIRDKAHRLSERFEEINEAQEDISKKLRDLIKRCYSDLPVSTLTNSDFKSQVEKIRDQVNVLNERLQKARNIYNKQNYHISKHMESKDYKGIQPLPDCKLDTIKEVITDLAKDVEYEIGETKSMTGDLEEWKSELINVEQTT
ncbi:nuclear pore complex protein Nup88-like [Teleopsis dalmanni]|uniref:nuclear pore complex protein Nup88-like n=1 Tax=Teleopsis dalmanni TaxID=139649 RepID=UPI0018CDF64C|nr:nuclear pore complex protein Nup88-like [Teleopsis dalmanni]